MFMEDYIAHIRKSDREEQGVFTHNDSVSYLAAALGESFMIGNLSKVAGRHHDDGKNTPEYRDYIKAATNGENVVKGSVIHSTQGAVLVDGFSNKHNIYSKLASEMIRTAIMSHHGLRDCISSDGKLTFAESKAHILDSYKTVERIVLQQYGQQKLEEELLSASEDAKLIQANISEFCSANSRYGSRHFYLAMYERLLTSILIDADRTDTACFEDNVRPIPLPQKEKLKEIWGKYLIHLENEITKLQSNKNPSPLDVYRAEISEACAKSDSRENGVFRLVVPCGAGKTLASLRYALHTASRYGKKHIFYIAPFNSILEQNADDIAKYIGDADAVLKHHCNVVMESNDKKEHKEDDEEYVKKYKLLIENWQHSSIIATSAVQFLNTLFAGKTECVRRMQALGDSVIIVDEIQALPVRVLKLFNGAMNFLARFCKTAVILCSATQPLLDKIDSYQIAAPVNIVPNEERYIEAFRRVEIEDHISGNGFSISEAADFIFKSVCDVQSILAVVNTKPVARDIYKSISKLIENSDKHLLFHLSTNMCPAHRAQVIGELKKCLNNKEQAKKVICVSTSLIEAGVDLSFSRVVRSLTGLDSIIQAAGRCNRNRETDLGLVSVIFIRDEKVDKLGNILGAQQATREVFHNIRSHPECYTNGALSKVAMDEFYTRYYHPLLPEMAFPLKNNPEYTILNLLTINLGGSGKLSNAKSTLLKQAFKEAGDAFEAIESTGKKDVIVEYNEDTQKHIRKLLSARLISERKTELRYLQQYTVQISKYTLEKIPGGVRYEEDVGVYILPKIYYHEVYGVMDDQPTLIC